MICLFVDIDYENMHEVSHYCNCISHTQAKFKKALSLKVINTQQKKPIRKSKMLDKWLQEQEGVNCGIKNLWLL